MIRPTRHDDVTALPSLYLAAFGADEGGVVGGLACTLAEGKEVPPVCSLLAEEDGEVLGHIAFSPLTPALPAPAYLLAPLAVQPAWQRQGVGAALVRHGLEALKASGVAYVFVYGDPAYYGRFGFSAELARHFVPPYPLSQPHGWQALALGDAAVPAQTLRVGCVAALSDPALW
ncbi:GNAT family N-acetyltransferase [Chitinibacteraceae bacterium HSL-7]